MKRTVKIFWRLFAAGLLAFILLIVLANFGVFGKMPSIEELQNPTIQQASEVLSDDGTLMGKYYTERGNRTTVRYRDLSPFIMDALIATEDERFEEHSGIDFWAVMRAAGSMGSKGGGSTITQQLALNLFDERATNKMQRVMQKLKEWIIAIKLERNFTKEEIITLYLNAVPFGDNIYGIRNASRTFFKKEPKDLKVEEAAVLVGMLKANNYYNPRRNPERAKDRRNIVLGQMVKNDKITAVEADKLKPKPIELSYEKQNENTGYAPYFREILKDEVRGILKELKKPTGGEYNIYNDGLKIYTTINPQMQLYAEEAVAAQMPRLQKALVAQAKFKNGSVWKGRENVLEAAMKASDRWKNMEEDGATEEQIRASFKEKTAMTAFAWNKNRQIDTTMTPFDSIVYHRQVLQAGFLAMDPITGEVKAWVGGVNFKTYKYDHVNLKTKRQVGSTIKPLLYMQAMEERGFTPETMVEDVQQNFGGNRLVPATGRTCTGRSMTMASALAASRNCATAYIMKQVGPAQFADFINRLNIPTKVDPNPSIALGSCDLSLFEMLWGYSVFAGRGFSTKPNFITRIEDRNGNVIYRADNGKDRKEAVSEYTAYTMSRMMQGTVQFGTARGLINRLGVTELAGKTGTTNDNADGWFIGFSPQLLAGVWIGCDDRFLRIENSLGYGGTAAMPIWENFFKKVYDNKKLGIERTARFVPPAETDIFVNSADWIPDFEKIQPGAEGEDVGVGTADDYNYEYIPAESTPVQDNENLPAKPKVDTTKSATKPKEQETSNKEDAPKKKGILKKIFGNKKDKSRE